MSEEIKNLSDEELVEQSGSWPWGVSSEVKDRRAQAEMVRRLKDSIDKMSSSTNFYSDRLLDVTILLFLVGVMQLLVSLRTISESWGQWLISGFIFMFAIYLVVRFIVREREKREKEKGGQQK